MRLTKCPRVGACEDLLKRDFTVNQGGGRLPLSIMDHRLNIDGFQSVNSVRMNGGSSSDLATRVRVPNDAAFTSKIARSDTFTFEGFELTSILNIFQ